MAFETTTTKFAGPTLPSAPPFAWSFTKLKNFRSCPKRHFHYDIAKDIREERSEDLAYGDEVHDAMHARLAKNTPLPGLLRKYEPIAEEFLKGTPDPAIQVLVEQKFGCTRDFEKCDFFSKPPKAVWFRSIADAVKLKTLPDGRMIAVNWDWKTGKPPSTKGQKDDPVQILMAASNLMIHYPKLIAVANAFVWMDYGMKTEVTLRREQLPELWATLIPEVAIIQEAERLGNYPPKKNGLCRAHCGVETCQFHGG